MESENLILALLLLHGPTGREVRVNPNSITSLHSSIPGQPNRVLTGSSKCLINLADGKFVSVAETCEMVSGMIDQARRK